MIAIHTTGDGRGVGVGGGMDVATSEGAAMIVARGEQARTMARTDVRSLPMPFHPDQQIETTTRREVCTRLAVSDVQMQALLSAEALGVIIS